MVVQYVQYSNEDRLIEIVIHYVVVMYNIVMYIMPYTK